MKKKAIFILFVLCSCLVQAQDISGKLYALKMQSIDGSSFSFNELKNNKVSVIIFLSPDCPLCQNYALTIREMKEAYDKTGVRFYGIFPGTWYSVDEIKKFKSDYKLQMIMLTDKGKALTHLLHARVTPEAVVLDAQGKIIYQGRIDNWMYAAGKNRAVITKHELKDALEAIVNNKAIVVSKTEPVGCLIE